MNQLKAGFLSALIFQFITISINLHCQTSSDLYNLLLKLPKDTIITLKTYDGSGQTVHPDIIYIPQANQFTASEGQGIGGGKFYLSLTPYPNFNDSLENPCIYESMDGLNFTEPKGTQNPIVNTPFPYRKNNHHNDDPDISYSEKNKSFRIFYIQTMSPDSQLLNSLESIDLLSWKKRRLIKYNFKKNEKFILSPSLTEKKNKYFLFYVNKRKDNKNTVEYLESKSPYKWNKRRAKQIKIHLPDTVTPWHIDIVRNNNKYYMLLNAFVGDEPKWGDQVVDKYVLYLAESNDLKEWHSLKKIMDCCEIPDIDCRYVYRSTGLVENDLLVVWYSYTNWKPQWRIGIKKFKLAESY